MNNQTNNTKILIFTVGFILAAVVIAFMIVNPAYAPSYAPGKPSNTTHTNRVIPVTSFGYDNRPTKPTTARYVVARNISNIHNTIAQHTISTPTPIPSRSGTINMLVVAVDFPDVTGTMSISGFQDMLFGNHFGTLHDYFFRNSNGLLNISGTVVASNSVDTYIRLPHTMTWYANGQSGTGSGQNDQILVSDTIHILKQNNFDFTPYIGPDNKVDYLSILHAGMDASAVHSSTIAANSLWSVRWGMNPISVTIDNTTTLGYASNFTIDPELGVSLTLRSTIGGFAHELTHLLGMPDLYDTSWQESGDGDFALLSGGMWNGPYVCYPDYPGAPVYCWSDASVPSNMDPFSRIYFGWAIPISFTSISDMVVGNIYTLPIDSSSYYLIEKRVLTGYDAYLPIKSSGILVWRVNSLYMSPLSAPWKQNTLNTPANMSLRIIEANGATDLTSTMNGDGGDANDVFTNTFDSIMTATPTITVTPSPINTSTPTLTSTPNFTDTPSPTDTITPTPTPTVTPTPNLCVVQ